MVSTNTMLTTSQLVSIQTVDPIHHTATGLTRQGNYLEIDTRYLVGAIHVVPAPGEQWFVKRLAKNWALDAKLPYADDTLSNVADDPSPGLMQLGGTTGPTMLVGSVVKTDAPFRLLSAPTGGKPDPVAAGAGALLWNSTTAQTEVSNGTAWTPIPSGSGTVGAAVMGEIPTGTKNGSNTIFTTAHNFATASSAIYRNGIRELRGTSYTETPPTTLTFTTAPLGDDEIVVDYLIA